MISSVAACAFLVSSLRLIRASFCGVFFSTESAFLRVQAGVADISIFLILKILYNTIFRIVSFREFKVVAYNHAFANQAIRILSVICFNDQG